MIAEAIDAAYTIGWTILAWIVLTAAAVTLALYTVVAAVAWPCNAARDALCGALSASRALRALPEHQQAHNAARGSSVPSWAREPHDHQEAA